MTPGLIRRTALKRWPRMQNSSDIPFLICMMKLRKLQRDTKRPVRLICFSLMNPGSSITEGNLTAPAPGMKSFRQERISEMLPTGCWKENRSEEHTSELQSRGHLVCRLLLEKKKVRSG